MITLVMMPEHSCTLPSSGENMGNISCPSSTPHLGITPAPATCALCTLTTGLPSWDPFCEHSFCEGVKPRRGATVPAVPSDQWLHLVAHIIIVCLIFAGGGHMWYCDQRGYYHPGTLDWCSSIFCHLQADTSKAGVVLASDAALTKYILLSSWRFPSTLQMGSFVPTLS